MLHPAMRRPPLRLLCLVLLLSLLAAHCLWPGSRHDQTSVALPVLVQNISQLNRCPRPQIVISSRLESRQPWKTEARCSPFRISFMVPGCRLPVALASYPGSGNTWMRYLIDHAGGIFTGSRYSDLELLTHGFWGEMREWDDGTTIVQKTHDASRLHVQKDFGARCILLLRNPYDAILSMYNYLYAGHTGTAPGQHFGSQEWSRFVAIQASKWLDMASNWTMFSTPQACLLVHYELLKLDPESQVRRVLQHLRLPLDQQRLDCALNKMRDQLFRRRSDSRAAARLLPFSSQLRRQMDKLIRHVNHQILVSRGYPAMPLSLYRFFEKTDLEIMADMANADQQPDHSKRQEPDDSAMQLDRMDGTRMILDGFIERMREVEKGGQQPVDSKSSVLSELLIRLRQSQTGGSLLTKAVQLLPIIQRSLSAAKDPIEIEIEKESYRASQIDQLLLPS